MTKPDPYWIDGHGQEVIPVPLADGRVMFVPVLGCATLSDTSRAWP